MHAFHQPPLEAASVISNERLLQIAYWARDLSPAEIERAARGVTEKTWEAGAFVIHRGDRLDAWSGVASGLLKMSTGSVTGKAVTLAGLPAGAWFGEGSLIKNEPRMYDIVALRDSRIASMNRATFFWLYENSVAFNRFLVRQFNERLGQFIALVEHDRILDATARVARSIAWLFNPSLNPFAGSSLKISQEELGLLAGVSRQAANRALKDLESAGLIAQSNDGVSPRNLAALSRYGE